MERRAFGSTGIEVCAIGQGTWDVPEHGSGRAAAVAALRRGIELGMTHIDTAEMYGAGRAEEIVGEALAGLARERVFLASKVLPTNATYEGTIAACERSLRRIGTGYLDLYLLHWPGNVPVEETMGALEQLVADGKVRFIGVSNFDLEELREAQAALRTQRLACNQVLYHLRERGVEARVAPYCKEQNIAVVAYTPFGRGSFLQGNGSELLVRLADKYGKTPRQVVLRFLTRDSNFFTIPKASSAAHVEENAGGSDWTLEAQDAELIDAMFPVRDRGTLATL